MSEEALEFFNKTGLEGKETLCKEVVTYAFKKYKDCYDIAKYIQERFKSAFKNDSWCVFTFKIDEGSGFADYKNTFIGINYAGFKTCILNN